MTKTRAIAFFLESPADESGGRRAVRQGGSERVGAPKPPSPIAGAACPRPILD